MNVVAVAVDAALVGVLGTLAHLLAVLGPIDTGRRIVAAEVGGAVTEQAKARVGITQDAAMPRMNRKLILARRPRNKRSDRTPAATTPAGLPRRLNRAAWLAASPPAPVRLLPWGGAGRA